MRKKKTGSSRLRITCGLRFTHVLWLGWLWRPRRPVAMASGQVPGVMCQVPGLNVLLGMLSIFWDTELVHLLVHEASF